MNFFRWLFGVGSKPTPKKREWLEPKYKPGMKMKDAKKEWAKELDAASRDLEDAVIEDEKRKEEKEQIKSLKTKVS